MKGHSGLDKTTQGILYAAGHPRVIVYTYICIALYYTSFEIYIYNIYTIHRQ